MPIDIDKLKARFSVSPLIDSEIDVAGMGLVGLSPMADHELRQNVTAAVIAHFMGYKSIDRIKKKYSENMSPHTPRDNELRGLCMAHLFEYDCFYKAFELRDSERIGVFAFDMALIRSRPSIELMLTTARQGFLIEPCLIARSLVEQFAYAKHVWLAEDNDTVFGTKPQSSLSSLKDIQPEIGKAYGLLSEMAHYNPRLHYSFIGEPEQHKEIESSTILQRSWKFKIVSLVWVFFVLDLKYRLFKFCYGSHKNFKSLSKLDGDVLLSFDRFFDQIDLPQIKQVRELIASE